MGAVCGKSVQVWSVKDKLQRPAKFFPGAMTGCVPNQNPKVEKVGP